jgi:hypothetical protein
MTNEQRTLLVGILSATDALWLPVRHLQTNAWQNVAEGRRAYRAGSGTGWRPLAGATETLRKQRQRALDTMSADGLVNLARRRETRLVGATLTARGEAMARALCGLPGWQASRASEDELRRLADSKFAAVEGGWISECGLAGSGYGDDMDSAAFVLAENMILPSLVAGRVASLSDSLGRCWYMLTDDGTPNVPPEPTDVEPCDDLRTFYDAELARHLHELTTAKPRNTLEIGPIPMPACVLTCSD